jgi:hypothetical protein
MDEKNQQKRHSKGTRTLLTQFPGPPPALRFDVYVGTLVSDSLMRRETEEEVVPTGNVSLT